MILPPPALPAPALPVQGAATTRDTALSVARAFVQRVPLRTGTLSATLIQAGEDSYLPGAYRKGESLWRIVSPAEDGITMLVPYRSAYVARYDDGRSFFRSKRAGWGRTVSAPRARGLALAELRRIGVPKGWSARPDSFTLAKVKRSASWPAMAMTGLVERPRGFPVVGEGNAAEAQFEAPTGALRWFSIRRDRRFGRPGRTIGSAEALRRARFSPTSGVGTGQLVWDARDPDATPRLAYRFVSPRMGTALVDAETGKVR